MFSLTHLDSLPADVQKKYAPYLENLFKVYGDQILCVCLYGSAAGKDYLPGISDINSVIVLREHHFAFMQKSLKIIRDGLSKKITAPLFITRHFLESSLDVFPIEFLEIKEHHACLFGEDLFVRLAIPSENLRALCKQQLKGKILRIQQSYLENGLDKKRVRAILTGSLNSLVPVFKNILRLRGKPIIHEKEKMITMLCQEYALGNIIFLSILKDKTREKILSHQEVDLLLQQFLLELETLSSRIDQP